MTVLDLEPNSGAKFTFTTVTVTSAATLAAPLASVAITFNVNTWSCVVSMVEMVFTVTTPDAASIANVFPVLEAVWIPYEMTSWIPSTRSSSTAVT